MRNESLLDHVLFVTWLINILVLFISGERFLGKLCRGWIVNRCHTVASLLDTVLATVWRKVPLPPEMPSQSLPTALTAWVI